MWRNHKKQLCYQAKALIDMGAQSKKGWLGEEKKKKTLIRQKTHHLRFDKIHILAMIFKEIKKI